MASFSNHNLPYMVIITLVSGRFLSLCQGPNIGIVPEGQVLPIFDSTSFMYQHIKSFFLVSHLVTRVHNDQTVIRMNMIMSPCRNMNPELSEKIIAKDLHMKDNLSRRG